MEAITREEKIMSGENLTPITRKEMFLAKAAGQNIETPEPITREEMFLSNIGGGGGDLDALIDGSLTEVTSNAEKVRNYAFNECKFLENARFENETDIGQHAFEKTTSLQSAIFCKSCTVNYQAFYQSGVTKVTFLGATNFGNGVFLHCSQLKLVDAYDKFTMQNSMFDSCSMLETLIMRWSTMNTLKNASLLEDSKIASGEGYIYVPSALIEDYKAATNWSNFADQFRALEDYTVDGTITGELDPDKV